MAQPLFGNGGDNGGDGSVDVDLGNGDTITVASQADADKLAAAARSARGRGGNGGGRELIRGALTFDALANVYVAWSSDQDETDIRFAEQDIDLQLYGDGTPGNLGIIATLNGVHAGLGDSMGSLIQDQQYISDVAIAGLRRNVLIGLVKAGVDIVELWGTSAGSAGSFNAGSGFGLLAAGGIGAAAGYLAGRGNRDDRFGGDRFGSGRRFGYGPRRFLRGP